MTNKLPANHQAVMPYLILDDAQRFIEFTQTVFGASLLTRHMREDGQAIMHAEISIGGCTIMFGEATPEWKAATAGLFIYVDDADKVYAAALANSATSVMPVMDKDYGRTCGVMDPTGNTWWITAR